MSDSPRGDEVVAIFARLSARMNALSRDWLQHPAYASVLPSDFVGMRGEGWMLSKYLEATIAGSEGHALVWAMEMVESGARWVLSCDWSISHTDIHEALGQWQSASPPELARAGEEALARIHAHAERTMKVDGAAWSRIIELHANPAAGAAEKSSR